jgi:Uma2 family endonuclease
MSAASPPKSTSLAPLRDGERLTRAEFMRRWEAQPELKFAERIEGVVHLMASPVSPQRHGNPSEFIGWCLANYSMVTRGTFVAGESTFHIDGDNDIQPDHALTFEPGFGGQTSEDGEYISGAPELVVEVSASTVRRDLGVKFKVYRRAGVKEYLVWETKKKTIHCFVNSEGEFLPATLNDGVFKSQAFPGLWIDVAALVADDMVKVKATSEAGLASKEHAEFVKMLAEQKK